MATIGEFIHELIKKTGHNGEGDDIKNFLMNGELVKIEMPEAVSGIIDKGLISLKDAKNNHPDIKPHYTYQALLTVDKTVEKLLDDLGFDDAAKAEVLSESSSYKKIPLLANKLKELEGRKNITDKDKQASIQKQIDELQKQIREEKGNAENAKKEYEGKLMSYKKDARTDSLFLKYPTIYDDLDPEVKTTTLRTLLNKKLQETNAEFTFDENDNFVLRKKDGTNYYGDNQQQLDPKQFAELLLSQNKLLKTTPKPDGQQSNNFQQSQPQNGQGKNPGSQALKGLLAGALNDINKSSEVSVMGN